MVLTVIKIHTLLAHSLAWHFHMWWVVVVKGPCIVMRNEVRGQARMNGRYCCLQNIWSVQLAPRAV